jgi:putative tryptophan/tyrosine transport system substrate-binding protein
MRWIGLAVVFSLGVAVALTQPAGAQQAPSAYRIGLLDYGTPDVVREGWWNAFRDQMRQLGYVEGKTVSFESRWARGDNDRLSKLAAELVGLKVDLIATAGTNAAIAAKQATSTIPIVMAIGSGAVEVGLVAALRQPGGNVTGMSSIQSELAGKRLEFLKAVAPRTTRVAIVWDEANPVSRLALDETVAAARAMSLTIMSAPVRSAAGFEAAFAGLARDHADAVGIVPSSMLFPHRKRLAELATKHRLPSVVGSREYVEAGGLVGYGTDYRDLFRHAATFADKILKGTKPTDLPIEQPTKFELVINLRTTRALGLTIPRSVLQRADQIIE